MFSKALTGKAGDVEDACRHALQGLLKVGIRRARSHGRGFTASQCWSVDLDDGRRVFAKVAAEDEGAAGNRIEAIVLGTVRSPHVPALVASTDDGRLLVTEDLSDSDWEPHVGDLETHPRTSEHLTARRDPNTKNRARASAPR
ncbi:MAG: hypothetical protein ACRD29_26950 [Acidimicrobiales bacterium]